METEDLELNETNPIQTNRDWSTDSPPFHGFSGQPPEVKIDGAEEQEITDTYKSVITHPLATQSRKYQ